MTDSSDKLVDKDGFELVRRKKKDTSKRFPIQPAPGTQKSPTIFFSASSASSSSDDSLGEWSSYSDEDPLEIDELFG